MAITVNGTTITDVTVNGTAMDVVNVNGVEVFRKQLSPIWYNGIELTKDHNGGIRINDYNVHQVSNVTFAGSQVGDWQYFLNMDIRNDSSHSCIIFKDFTQIVFKISTNSYANATFRCGTCSKSATVSDLINGSGIIHSRTFTIYDDSSVIPVVLHIVNVNTWGDTDNNCFVMHESGGTAYTNAHVLISPDFQGGTLGGYRYY